MKHRSLAGFIRGAVFAALTIMATGLVSGPGFVSQAEAAVVSSVAVNGNQRVDADTIRAYLLVKPGRSFSAEDVDESLKALFETGLFSDVQINQRGSTLVVHVEENPIINRINFEGNKKFKDDQLKGVVSSQPRGVFTRAKVQNDVQRILELYRRSGRFQGSVTPKVIDLPENRVNLVYEVSEGPKTGVSRITFIGNQHYSDGRLRNVVQTRESGLLSFLRSGDTYDPDRLSSDEERLRRFYLNRGFADYQLVSSVADLDRERNAFFVTFTMDEGPEYRFGQIQVDSIIPGIDPQSLMRLVTTDEGDVYSSEKVEKSMEAITIELASSGYAFAQVRPRVDRDPVNHTIGITYIVDEGPRAYIERIEISGNDRTRDYVIRREFDISEGDAYNRVLIDRAERRLRNLNYFDKVTVGAQPGSAPDRVIVTVSVQEKATGELSFGAGYSTSDGVLGDVSLTERNFLGRGYFVRAAVGAGESSKTYEFAFTDPYFLGRRVSAGFNVYRKDYEDNDYRSYDYTTTGGGITFGFPITEDFTVQLGYKIEQQEIDVPDFDIDTDPISACRNSSKAVCLAEGDTLVSSAVWSMIYDTLDNRLDPRDGMYGKLTQEIAGVGGDVSFVRTTASASLYRELLVDQEVIGMLRVQGGNITGLGEDVRLLDAFYKGGETIRGFESSGIGPRDIASDDHDALGAKYFAAATAEVVFPFPALPRELGLRAALFADAGTAWGTDISESDVPGIDVVDENGIRSSVGASLLWASPLGPIRADFAYVLSKEDYDETQFFRIGGGTKF
ncbi:outer membrane protein assembly factor BamA [Afifella marina]|nr:outer membrane protein assembly factor BamA [Afifella marina]MBK1623667.1 outer membrane protein assembly factor BamA [Afifella marina DSM 2698]MBK1626660.1 outer membrane protein assembly factor BamA [Afifella marina]MBK5916209.1 outer membrane protein assembly factor BamA [Afifella marina]RAI21594.1 outer membrane protein assembly factor BamA [Afifella marina DSM 2698]